MTDQAADYEKRITEITEKRENTEGVLELSERRYQSNGKGEIRGSLHYAALRSR
jgi:hypothetical protein